MKSMIARIGAMSAKQKVGLALVLIVVVAAIVYFIKGKSNGANDQSATAKLQKDYPGYYVENGITYMPGGKPSMTHAQPVTLRPGVTQ